MNYPKKGTKKGKAIKSSAKDASTSPVSASVKPIRVVKARIGFTDSSSGKSFRPGDTVDCFSLDREREYIQRGVIYEHSAEPNFEIK